MGELKGAMTLNAVPNLIVLLTHPNPNQFVSCFSMHLACISAAVAPVVSACFI